MRYSIGVDVGGTKIATAILNDQGDILARVQVPTNTESAEALFQQIVRCVEETLRKLNMSINDVLGIGIGVPGKVDYRNGVAIFQNNLPWENFPVIQRLKSYFTIENVVMDNDVYMAGFAEWKKINQENCDTFVYLTISTGISCCLIHKNSFIRGNGFAGEIGFLPIKENLFNEFNRLEEVASGPGIEKKATIVSSDTGGITNVKPAEIFEGFEKQQKISTEIINEILVYYAKGIYSISCLLDPNYLVLGGGIINHNPYLLDEIKKRLDNYLVEEQKDILNRMNVSQFSNDAGLIGAGLRAIEFY